jgi:hypothetical protein
MTQLPVALPSSSAFLSAETWTWMLFSSTTRPGQTRAMSSSLVTISPFAEARTIRISSARLPRGTGFPSRNRPPCAKSRQNRPKWISSVIVGSQGLRIQDNSGRAKDLKA